MPVAASAVEGTCDRSCTYLERLVVNALGADVVLAGVNEGHGLWEGRQLRDVIFSNHQLLQLGQSHKRFVIDGRYLVGG